LAFTVSEVEAKLPLIELLWVEQVEVEEVVAPSFLKT
jgi:hypothetical protein